MHGLGSRNCRGQREDCKKMAGRHTESPKCLEILPLKGWKPPPAGILRALSFFGRVIGASVVDWDLIERCD